MVVPAGDVVKIHKVGAVLVSRRNRDPELVGENVDAEEKFVVASVETLKNFYHVSYTSMIILHNRPSRTLASQKADLLQSSCHGTSASQVYHSKNWRVAEEFAEL